MESWLRIHSILCDVLQWTASFVDNVMIELKQATLARDKVKLAVLRRLRSELTNKQKDKGIGAELEYSDCIKVVQVSHHQHIPHRERRGEERDVMVSHKPYGVVTVGSSREKAESDFALGCEG